MSSASSELSPVCNGTEDNNEKNDTMSIMKLKIKVNAIVQCGLMVVVVNVGGRKQKQLASLSFLNDCVPRSRRKVIRPIMTNKNLLRKARELLLVTQTKTSRTLMRIGTIATLRGRK